MPLVAVDIECLEGKIVKELGIFKDGIVLGCSFLPPKDYKPTFQTKWNTKNMHGINWNHGQLDYSELAFIIHQYCSPTTEYFAKGLEKCQVLSPYLCKDVGNLDDLGCPKASKLLEKMMLKGIAATTRIDTRSFFTVQKRKLTLMGNGL